jgi:hypothetical protein
MERKGTDGWEFSGGVGEWLVNVLLVNVLCLCYMKDKSWTVKMFIMKSNDGIGLCTKTECTYFSNIL